jgi:hypothetical protein
MKGKEVLEDQTLGRKFCERDLNPSVSQGMFVQFIDQTTETQQRPTKPSPRSRKECRLSLVVYAL